ncbi:MAG: ferrous iron transport protein B, partial [Dysgonamonadaceae bacterium]|nr:ferrous iron transport protein B [Dysgonamonadaceae bacterium]
MKLSELKASEKGIIVKVFGRGAFRKRIIEMGFIKGKPVEIVHNAPLKDPIIYKIMDYEVSLRRKEATLVEIVSESEIKKIQESQDNKHLTVENDEWYEEAIQRSKVIQVALVGNPNSGKTSLFNIASGSKERVGNYSGVTVDAKEGVFKYKGYTFKLIDLPGTYSLTAYSPEELYVRKQISNGNPDIIINVVSASNLERNLYLTTQLIDMDVPMVIALNMYDELEASGATFDYDMLSILIGSSIVPTVSKTGKGIEQLFDKVISTYEGENPVERHIHIHYGEVLEQAIAEVSRELKKNDLTEKIPPRFISIKLLENDNEIEKYANKFPNAREILEARNKEAQKVLSFLKEDCETAFTDKRYGFIDGALKETYREGKKDILKTTRMIDFFVTHKYWGYPIFFLFMFLMFEGTFILGEYPKEWLEDLVKLISGTVENMMPEGALKALIATGIIGGVGNVLVFLPYIVILYLFISFMEDSGYMARAAFIMDKFMHKIGLHGKSFIPLVMGFGCNVPAIMATRTIESRNSRLITILISPLMSCSARLPVYILFVGVFFSKYQGFILLLLYITGIMLAAITSRLLKKFLIKEDDIPFVMELPPYRLPTAKAIFHHMWGKASQYMKKMGGI